MPAAPGQTLASLVATLALAASLWPAAAARASTTPWRTLANGLEVITVPAPRGHTVAVRLEVDVGLRDDAPDQPGLAAAYLAALLRGPTQQVPPGGLDVLASQAGLSVEPSLDHDALAVTLVGPPPTLGRALWLAAERITGPWVGEAGLEVVRSAIWLGATRSQYMAVSGRGDPIETTLARALGPRDGHSAYASRRAASELDDDALWGRIEMARRLARPRVIISGSAEALADIDALVDLHLSTLPPSAIVGPRPAPPPAERTDRVPLMRLSHPRDQRHLVVVAYDLRRAVALSGADRTLADAVLFTWVDLLQHPGGPLHTRLVESRPALRGIEVRLYTDEVAALAVEGEVRGADVRDARELLVQELERLRTETLSAARVRAASRAAARGMRDRWARAEARAELAGALVRSGRVRPGEALDGWLRRFLDALDELGPADVRELAAWGLQPDRRIVTEFEPEELPPGARLRLTAEVLDTHRRVMVDIRCPPPQRKLPLGDLLEAKYGLTVQQYVAITRAVGARPDLHREIAREVEFRCQELQELRALMPPERVVALHEAVACGPGRQRDGPRRDQALKRIFKRYDLDPSAYRPLVEMAREDFLVTEQLRAIDQRCQPRFGPAAPR